MAHIRKKFRFEPVGILHLLVLSREFGGLLFQLCGLRLKLPIACAKFFGQMLGFQTGQQIGKRRIHPELRLIEDLPMVVGVDIERGQRNNPHHVTSHEKRNRKNLSRGRRAARRFKRKKGVSWDITNQRDAPGGNRPAKFTFVFFGVEALRRVLAQTQRSDPVKQIAALATHIKCTQMRSGNLNEFHKKLRGKPLNIPRRNHRLGDFSIPFPNCHLRGNRFEHRDQRG